MTPTVHSFSIIAERTDAFLRSDEWISEDSTIVRGAGRITVEFERAAATLEEAVESAIADVLRSGGRIIRVDA